jgi:hypothetical protein
MRSIPENQHEHDNGFMVDQARGEFSLAKPSLSPLQIAGSPNLVRKSSVDILGDSKFLNGTIGDCSDADALMEQLQVLVHSQIRKPPDEIVRCVLLKLGGSYSHWFSHFGAHVHPQGWTGALGGTPRRVERVPARDALHPAAIRHREASLQKDIKANAQILIG